MAASLKPKRAALYLRVSTDRQTVENQAQALMAIAEHRGWEIVATYSDKGISGAKGRRDRPQFDEMLTDASRGRFDVVMAFALDRIGRSLSDLLATIRHLQDCNVGLFIDKASADGDVIDTTTAMGKLFFTVVAAFSEFERDMIVQRVNAGLDRARKAGKKLGRPRVEGAKERAVRAALARGDMGILRIAADLGVGSSTVQRIKREMTARLDPQGA
jgi:DNA invertase Pin-like site-specific DNA recombinase